MYWIRPQSYSGMILSYGNMFEGIASFDLIPCY